MLNTDDTQDTKDYLIDEIHGKPNGLEFHPVKNPNDREMLEKRYGQVWDTDEFVKAFQVTSFLAPFVMVQRRSDGVTGTLKFQHLPRYYFSFLADGGR